MSTTLSIQAKERNEFGTASSRRLRREGLVPVVIYSHGAEPTALTIAADDAAKLQYHNGMLELVDEAGKKMMAIMKELQVHPLNGKVLHVDFLAVTADEVIESTVNVEVQGEALGLRAGGQPEQILFELAIKCKPADIPEKIFVDVSNVDVDQALHVKDVVAPAGVEIITDPELIVFSVRSVKEEAEAPAEDAAAAEEKK